MGGLGGRIVAALLAATLGGCTAVIDQSSFFPTDIPETPGSVLTAPPGVMLEHATVELQNLGTMHIARLDRPGTDTVIIYSGGNGSYVSEESARAGALSAATGADVILYDYPGRGGTTVPSTIDAAIATGPALVRALKEKGWIGRGPLFAYGLSFGGSQAAAMAREGGFAGLMIEGSAADIAAVGRNFVPPLAKPFVRLRVDPALSRFDYLGYAVAARAPVLLISSTGDNIVRPRNMADFARQLKAAGREVTTVSAPGAHGTALRDAKTRDAVAAFVRGHGG